MLGQKGVIFFCLILVFSVVFSVGVLAEEVEGFEERNIFEKLLGWFGSSGNVVGLRGECANDYDCGKNLECLRGECLENEHVCWRYDKTSESHCENKAGCSWNKKFGIPGTCEVESSLDEVEELPVASGRGIVAESDYDTCNDFDGSLGGDKETCESNTDCVWNRNGGICDFVDFSTAGDVAVWSPENLNECYSLSEDDCSENVDCSWDARNKCSGLTCSYTMSFYGELEERTADPGDRIPCSYLSGFKNSKGRKTCEGGKMVGGCFDGSGNIAVFEEDPVEANCSYNDLSGNEIIVKSGDYIDCSSMYEGSRFSKICEDGEIIGVCSKKVDGRWVEIVEGAVEKDPVEANCSYNNLSGNEVIVKSGESVNCSLIYAGSENSKICKNGTLIGECYDESGLVLEEEYCGKNEACETIPGDKFICCGVGEICIEDDNLEDGFFTSYCFKPEVETAQAGGEKEREILLSGSKCGDTICSGDKPVCRSWTTGIWFWKKDNNKCVECIADVDCGTGEICSSFVCKSEEEACKGSFCGGKCCSSGQRCYQNSCCQPKNPCKSTDCGVWSSSCGESYFCEDGCKDECTSDNGRCVKDDDCCSNDCETTPYGKYCS